MTVPIGNVYLGSSSTFIARASSFGNNLGLAGAAMLLEMMGDGTGGAKNDGREGACAVSVLFTSTLSAWKLYRSLDGSFGAEVFATPNSGLVADGGERVGGGVGGVGLPLIWTVSSAGSIISAGRIGILETSFSWVLDDGLAGGVLRFLGVFSSSSRMVIVSTTFTAERVSPLSAGAKGSARVGLSISGGGLERFVPCERRTKISQAAHPSENQPTFGTVASMMACADISGSCSFGFSVGLGLARLATGFLTGGGGLTGLAVWYGFETSGFFVGVTSLMSSVIKPAARVGRVGGDACGGESLSFHVCRKGDGMAGVVCFMGSPPVRTRGSMPLAFGVTGGAGGSVEETVGFPFTNIAEGPVA